MGRQEERGHEWCLGEKGIVNTWIVRGDRAEVMNEFMMIRCTRAKI